MMHNATLNNISVLWYDLLYFLWCSLYCKLDTVKEEQGVELKLISWLYNNWLYLQLQYLFFRALQCNPWPSVASLCVWYFCYYPYSNNMKFILFNRNIYPEIENDKFQIKKFNSSKQMNFTNNYEILQNKVIVNAKKTANIYWCFG